MAKRRLKDKHELDVRIPYDRMIMQANYLVHAAMKNNDFKSIIDEMKSEAIVNQGRSVGGNLRNKYTIPQDAYIKLPRDIQQDKKLQDEWVRYHHPYLVVCKFWG